MAKRLLFQGAPGGRGEGAILAQALLLFAALGAGPADAAPREYVIDPGACRVQIHVGKSGVFKFAGHAHEVTAAGVRGRITADPDAIGASRVEVQIDAASLRVDVAKEPSGDAPKVQETMTGPKVLDTARFAAISFRSTAVDGRATSPDHYDLQVRGDLTLHGVTRSLSVPVAVDASGGRLTATFRMTVAQDEFGMKPVSAGGGTVKVKNEVEVDLRLVAVSP